MKIISFIIYICIALSCTLAVTYGLFANYIASLFFLNPDACINAGNRPDKWEALSLSVDKSYMTLSDGSFFNARNWTYPMNYSSVSFKSRSRDNINLKGWWSYQYPGNPAIVITHGYQTCKSNYEVLLPAQMLARAGYNVLMMDMRNHGDSDTDADGIVKWGNAEYMDVLGGWDFVKDKGISADNIGLFAPSMGGTAVCIAGGNEPRVKSMWVDAAACSPFTILHDHIQSKMIITSPLATFFAQSAFSITNAKLKNGYDLYTKLPAAELVKLQSNQNFKITHTVGDTTVLPKNAKMCYEAAKSSNASRVDMWIMDDVTRFHTDKLSPLYEDTDSHAMAILYDPRTYEQNLVKWFHDTLQTHPSI